MGKNRIWKNMMTAGAVFLGILGTLLGLGTFSSFVRVVKAESADVFINQSANWTDQENFKASLAVTAGNLQSLEPEEEKYYLVVWISEYFQVDTAFSFPGEWLKKEMPVISKDGRSVTITRLESEIKTGETEKYLDIPMKLREEYRFLSEIITVPLCQELPFSRGNMKENTMGKGGACILKKEKNEVSLVCQGKSPWVEIPAAEVDFSMKLKAQGDAKAGKRICCQVEVANTGDIPLYKIHFKARVQGQNLTPVWETAPFVNTEETGVILEKLAEQEVRTLSFYMDLDEGQSGEVQLEVMAAAQNTSSEDKKESLNLVIQPAKAAFTVKKIADRDTAQPGDTVTYQISIHNTGDRTLHSVISTERFGLAGVRAVFLEKKGVILNKTKTQAKIPEIVPGGCINLKAKVVLPENLKDQNLVNQIIVVSDETGEETAVRDQAVIKVEKSKEKTKTAGEEDMGGTAGMGDYENSGSAGIITSPKTGDRSHKELFQVLILCSFFISALAARRMFFGRKD